jgi:hypothetical protein
MTDTERKKGDSTFTAKVSDQVDDGEARRAACSSGKGVS